MLRIFSIFVVMSSLATVSFAQDTARMEQVIQTYVAGGDFIGSVLVARGSDILLSKGYGPANFEWDIPNSPATKFRIASITKQFTAAAILLLEERGKLKVEDPVKKYLPEAPSSWDKITIFHLLTHTAGFGELAPPPGAAPIENSPLEAAVARSQSRPLVSQPGETFLYSDQTYLVLGHLIQKISGQSYETFLQENILKPQGLIDTGLDNPAILSRRASVYTATRNGLVNSYPAYRIVPNTGSGMYSTTEDLLRWQIALFGGKVLSPASLQKMTIPFKGDYGFGLYVRAAAGRKLYRHGGGSFATLEHFPESKITVVVIGNLNISPAQEIAGLLGALAHGDTIQLPSERNVLTLTPDILAKYVGVYQIPNGQTFTITLEGAQLMAQPRGGNKLPLLAESDTTFFPSGQNIRVEFVKDTDGLVTELILHAGTRQQRAPRTNITTPVR